MMLHDAARRPESHSQSGDERVGGSSNLVYVELEDEKIDSNKPPSPRDHTCIA